MVISAGPTSGNSAAHGDGDRASAAPQQSCTDGLPDFYTALMSLAGRVEAGQGRGTDLRSYWNGTQPSLQWIGQAILGALGNLLECRPPVVGFAAVGVQPQPCRTPAEFEVKPGGEEFLVLSLKDSPFNPQQDRIPGSKYRGLDTASTRPASDISAGLNPAGHRCSTPVGPPTTTWASWIRRAIAARNRPAPAIYYYPGRRGRVASHYGSATNNRRLRGAFQPAGDLPQFRQM
ncbi:hypothetical protein Bbelb_261070 [Branchiostoma belcheri]|nr:hypothetical protein Bbelb_261070 [Branchiostoma belcheri]